MANLATAIEWECRFQKRIDAWQRWYGDYRRPILKDCEDNRRLFAHGVI